MNFLSNPAVARLLWALPMLLLVIAATTTRAGLQQRAVYEQGETVTADVLGLDLRERSEITHGAVRLRYTMPGASAPTLRTAEMPLVLIKEIEAGLDATPEGQTYRVPLLVSTETDQVVLGMHPRGQWLLTFSLAGMALIGAIVSGLLVRGWNRLLARDGDPATRLTAA
ncbi:MAG TPA: hypothetical protein VGB53_08140 [Rubricoccaceae bacterium]|jgi:hypothetical protein